MTISEFLKRITVPHGYVQDTMTDGPNLMDGWSGDAWRAQDQGRGYFLRAWNDSTGQVAVVQSESSYEVAAMHLREKAQGGGDWTGTVRANF